jgi:serine/threonine protein kinase
MILEYCNGTDLGIFLMIRKTLNQTEVSLILRNIVKGLSDIWQLHMIHRDLKLANILLHFPDHPELLTMQKRDKLKFLQEVDLT